MKPTKRIRRIDLWLVTDGRNDMYVSLDETQARIYAKTINRHVAGPDGKRVTVETRSVKIAQPNA